MSTQPAKNTTFALQDILLGIAESLNEAQQALRDAPPYDALGRPNTMYQLPYLDFNLKVTSEFESEQAQTAEEQPRKAIRFRSAKEVATTKNNTSARTEILSTISGRFVAAVPNEGLPQTIIQVKNGAASVTQDGYYQQELEVQLSNAAGERLVDSIIEFNYDAEASAALNQGTIIDEPAVIFAKSEVKTDSNGLAKTSISMLNMQIDQGRYFIININSGTVNKSISISKH